MLRRNSLLASTMLLQLLLSCNLLQVVMAGYFTTPKVLWTHQIPGGGSLHGGRNLRQGNAVVVTPDGNHVLVTADDGTLHIMNARTPSKSIFYEPPISAGTYREGRSGVALVMQNATSSVVDHAVYAVIDTPEQVGVVYVEAGGDLINGTTTPSSDSFYSRVLGVDLLGNELWGVYVPGAVAGTPVVSTDQEKIFVAHNFDLGSEGVQGYVSIIDKSGKLLGSVVNNRIAPFGPPTLQSISGSHDMVIVAESWDDGYGLGQGQVQLLVPSDQYDANQGQGTSSYRWVVFSDWKLPALAKPLVKDSLLWVAGQGSTLAGWTSKTALLAAATGSSSTSGTNPTWKTVLQPSERNVTQPFGSAPVVSSDLTRLYVNGASIDFFCVHALTGKMLWNDTSGFSSHTAEPKLSEISGQNAVVYAIETLTGTIKQFDAETGQKNWAVGCEQFTNIQNCANAVEAEFSVSSDGNKLYFGDIFGKIYALQVANFVTSAPTSVPTPSPSLISVPVPSNAPTAVTSTTTAAPVATPVAASPVAASPVAASPVAASPVAVPVPTAPHGNLTSASASASASSQSADSNSKSPLPAVLGSVVGILALVAVIAGFFVYRHRRRQQAELAIEKQEKEERWRQERAEYEEECRRTEEEEILEIVAATTVLPAGAIMTTPTKEKKRRRKAKKAKSFTAPLTPSTLSSIEETPDEIDSIGSDRRGRPHRGSRSRSLDRLLAKLMRVKCERPPIRNLETAFENAAEEDIGADTTTGETQQEVKTTDEIHAEEITTEQLQQKSLAVEQVDQVEHGEVENEFLIDIDVVDAEPTLPRGVRARSVGPGLQPSRVETVNQSKPPRGHRSQSIERLLGRLTGIKLISGGSGDKASSAPALPEAPSRPVRSNVMLTSHDEVQASDELEPDLDLECRLSPAHVFEDNPDIMEKADPVPTTSREILSAESEQGNRNYVSQYALEPSRAKSPTIDESGRNLSEPISPIHSVGSSSNGRVRPSVASSRGSSMSPTNSCRSISSFSFEAYSLPGEDHSVSNGSVITEEQIMIRRRDMENRRNFDPIRHTHSAGDDDRPVFASRMSSQSSLEQSSSKQAHHFTSRSTSIQSSKPSDAIFPQLPGQKKEATPEDLLSVDSSLYLEDSRSQGMLSPVTVEQASSLLSNHSSPRSPETDVLFPQLPGQRKTPDPSDLIASLYMDDNSVSLSAITFEREKDDATVFSDMIPPKSDPADLETKRPKITLEPPEGVDNIEEDRVPPGAHYVRPPQAPGQTAKNNQSRTPASSKTATLPDIDISASASRYSRSLRSTTSASSYRSREINVEELSPRVQHSLSSRQQRIPEPDIAERHSHSIAGGHNGYGRSDLVAEKVFVDPSEHEELMNMRSGNSMLDQPSPRERPQRGVSSGAETRYSNSETSGEGSDMAVADTPKRSRRTASIPPKAGGVTDSWSNFLKDLAKAERAFFYPSMGVNVSSSTINEGDDVSEGEVTPPPPPPASPPPPAPPLLPRPVGEDTRRRLV